MNKLSVKVRLAVYIGFLTTLGFLILGIVLLFACKTFAQSSAEKATTDKVIVVFKESYGNAFSPYLAPHYERILLSFSQTLFHPYLVPELQKPLFCIIKEEDAILDLFADMSKNADYKSMKNHWHTQLFLRNYSNRMISYLFP